MATPAPAHNSGPGASGILRPGASSASASSSRSPRMISTARPPSLLASLSSARAAPALISDVRAVSVAVTGSSTGASASAFTSSIDVSRQIVSRPDAGARTGRERRLGTGSVASTARSGTSASTATATASAVASAASTRAAPPSSISSVSEPQNVPQPAEEPAAPAPPPPPTTTTTSEELDAADSTADSTSRPPAPPVSAHTQIAEARRALDASIANLLDTQLQDRAVLMHGNMRAIAEQQRDLGKATVALRKTNDSLNQLVDDVTMPLKEMGNMQNWAEMQYRGMLTLKETLRLVQEKRARREAREARAIEREAKWKAKREQRQQERTERGEAAEENGVDDSASDYSGSYTDSYSGSYTGSSGSGSRSRSRSRSNSRTRSTAEEPPIDIAIDTVSATQPEDSTPKDGTPKDGTPKDGTPKGSITKDKNEDKGKGVDPGERISTVAETATEITPAIATEEEVPALDKGKEVEILPAKTEAEPSIADVVVPVEVPVVDAETAMTVETESADHLEGIVRHTPLAEAAQATPEEKSTSTIASTEAAAKDAPPEVAPPPGENLDAIADAVPAKIPEVATPEVVAAQQGPEEPRHTTQGEATTEQVDLAEAALDANGQAEDAPTSKEATDDPKEILQHTDTGRLDFGKLTIGPPPGCTMPALPASYTHADDTSPVHNPSKDHEPAAGPHPYYTADTAVDAVEAAEEHMSSVEEQIDQFIKELDAERQESQPVSPSYIPAAADTHF